MSDIIGICPSGGLWYTCTAQTPTFFGCCKSNPCNGVGCPASDLVAAGLGTNNTSEWPNVQCSKGLWYTCATTNPTFQGCCISNPCHDGGSCPMGNLFPAAFGTVSSSTSTTASSSTSSTLTTSAASATTTSATQLSSVSPSSGTNVAAIAGGAAGGAFAGVLALLIIAFFVRRCWKKRSRARAVAETSPGSGAADTFLSKGPGPKTPSPMYNDEAYYPGQHIYGVSPVPDRKPVPSPQTPDFQQSPGLPSYQHSPQSQGQRSPYRDTQTTQISEIDSTALHEVGDGEWRLQRRSERGLGGQGLGLGVEGIAELSGRAE